MWLKRKSHLFSLLLKHEWSDREKRDRTEGGKIAGSCHFLQLYGKKVYVTLLESEGKQGSMEGKGSSPWCVYSQAHQCLVLLAGWCVVVCKWGRNAPKWSLWETEDMLKNDRMIRLLFKWRKKIAKCKNLSGDFFFSTKIHLKWKILFCY